MRNMIRGVGGVRDYFVYRSHVVILHPSSFSFLLDESVMEKGETNSSIPPILYPISLLCEKGNVLVWIFIRGSELCIVFM
jgi:hypothetical protein